MVIHKLDIRFVNELSLHLGKYLGEGNLFIMARNILISPTFTVLSNLNGIYVILEYTSENECNLHTYIDKPQRGKPFMSFMCFVRKYIEDNTVLNRVVFNVPNKYSGLMVLMSRMGVCKMYEGTKQTKLEYIVNRNVKNVECSTKIQEDS